MKKIFAILLLVLLPIFVNAEERVGVKIVPVENVYWNYYSNGNYYSGQFVYIYVNDRLAYSLDKPTELISESYKVTSERPNQTRTEDFVYFGYGYNGKDELLDYIATQARLWSYERGISPYFTTGPNGTGKEIDFYPYENELIEDYNNHFNLPDYGKNLIFNIGNKYTINNKKITLSNLVLKNETNNNISIDKNGNLLIETNQIGEYNFYIETNYPNKGDNIIYKSDDGKKIIVVGQTENLKKEYTYKVVGGSININVKFNKSSKENIVDNRFELYDSSEKLIGIYSPNEEGNITITNLKNDKYILKHIDITEGYLKENNEYLFEINNENLDITKEIILNMKTTKVSINKTYGNIILNDINYDSNTIYEIYDERGIFLNEVKTDENGYVEFTLDYGNYKIIESSTKRNINYIEINKTMFENNNHFDIHTYEYKTNLKIIALNKDTNEKISNVSFLINNNDYTTNEDGICIIKNIVFDTYKFNEINIKGFKKNDSFTYEINENNEFYIENNEPYTEIKLYLEKEEIINENKVTSNNTEEKYEQNNNTTIENEKQESNDNEEENINNEVKKDDVSVDIENTNRDNNEIKNQNNVTNNITSNKGETENIKENIEKLPFLGENKVNEDSKIIYYIYNFIKFNRL